MVKIAQANLFMQVLITERILVVSLKAIVAVLVFSEIGEGTHF